MTQNVVIMLSVALVSGVVGLWLLLTATSTLLVSLVDHALGLQYTWLAKPLVEGGLACVSFLLMRYVVYR